MFSVRKSLALAGATALIATGLVAGSATTASADAVKAKNSEHSSYQIRMWKDHNCPKTLEGFKRSAVVYEDEWAPFGMVGSFWMGKNRHAEIGPNDYYTTNAGMCVNFPKLPVAVVKYTKNK